MEWYLLKMFGISLALTIAIELTVAFLLRLCLWLHGKGRGGTGAALGSKRHMALLVLLVNVLTNPPAVLLCWLGRMYLPQPLSFPVQIGAEMAVVAAEAWIYRRFMEKPGWQTGKPLLLSVAANACSWTIGIVCADWIEYAVALFLRIRRVW